MQLKMTIAIIGALPEEIAMLKAHVKDQVEVKHNEFLTITRGNLDGIPVVFCGSGVGMVFASSTATVLCEAYKPSHMIFTGVAGALDKDLAIGDIVVGSDVVNYEMDVTNFKLPWDPSKVHLRGEHPFVNLRLFEGDSQLVNLAVEAKLSGARRVTGRIATGSEFLTAERKSSLAPVWSAVGDPIAVEMECAGVAQVARAYSVPFVALRAISDTAHGDANEDFNTFVQKAANNLWEVVAHIVHGVGKKH